MMKKLKAIALSALVLVSLVGSASAQAVTGKEQIDSATKTQGLVLCWPGLKCNSSGRI